MSKNKANGSTLFWGIVLLVIGLVFLLDNLGVDIDIWSFLKLWPIILIYFGGKALVDYYNRKKEKEMGTGEEIEKEKEKEND